MNALRTMLIWLAGVVACCGQALLVEKPLDKLSEQKVSDWGQLALELKTRWRHGESAHFIIHFTRDGDKIAGRSEGFYDDIWKFYGKRKDLLAGKKSHVFAFADWNDWAAFKEKVKMPRDFAGVTRGNEFFYVSTTPEGQFDTKGRTQAHEMSHLIINRFFEGRLPLWCNEGQAEYFGLRKTLDRDTFRRVLGGMRPVELDVLLATKTYPSDSESLRAFYAESALFVEFLVQQGETRPGLSETQRRGLMAGLIEDLIAGKTPEQALARFGFKDLKDVKTAYAPYRKRVAL